jgi:hypothetical protein
MRTGRWRGAALSVTASVVLAAGTLAFLAGTANAAKFVVVNSCSVSNQDNCTVSGTLPDPNYIAVIVIDLPQISGEPVSLSWTMDCDGVSQTSSMNAAIPPQQQGDGLDQMLPLTVSNPSSCSLQLTAYVPPQQNSYSLTVEIGYMPNPPASTSPSPSPTAGASQLVRGPEGTCLTDAGNGAAARTPVVIAKCSASAADQHWTYADLELKIHQDMCANAKGNGVSRGRVLLWPCTGAANEIWTHKADGEYVLRAGGSVLCLDDPRSSVKSGTQLIVYRCADTSNQQWSLP